jgi:CPA1 family monovalent cation:H+ antiporter
MLDIAAIFLVVTAFLAYVNHRFVRLPNVVGLMSIAMLTSLLFVGLEKLGIGLGAWVVALLRPVDFSKLLLQGMLSLLLFAGALHIDLVELRAYRGPVAILAFLGTMVSTALIGVGLWIVLPWLGLALPFSYCLVFGALISPTDPIAVLGIMRTAGAPKSVEIVISGESLFNDGVGVVLFTVAASMLDGVRPTPFGMLGLFALQAGGGMLFGYAIGYLTSWLLRTTDGYQVEVLVTLAAVIGGYALANHLGVSGPLAMVIAGLHVGHRRRHDHALSIDTRRRLDEFWELIDAVLNSVLFVLMGFEIILLKFEWALLGPTLVAIVLVLLARWITVALPVESLSRLFHLPAGAWKTLTWGGLRGGISVALALSLPRGSDRDTVVALTYGTVVFSILVQGLTIGGLVRRTLPCVPASKSSRDSRIRA